MRVSRLMLLVITLLGMVIAWNENSVIFEVVSFAWSGFGATFGPIILFSLFWKRTNRQAPLPVCWPAAVWCLSGSCA